MAGTVHRLRMRRSMLSEWVRNCRLPAKYASSPSPTASSVGSKYSRAKNVKRRRLRQVSWSFFEPCQRENGARSRCYSDPSVAKREAIAIRSPSSCFPLSLPSVAKREAIAIRSEEWPGVWHAISVAKREAIAIRSCLAASASPHLSVAKREAIAIRSL